MVKGRARRNPGRCICYHPSSIEFSSSLRALLVVEPTAQNCLAAAALLPMPRPSSCVSWGLSRQRAKMAGRKKPVWRLWCHCWTQLVTRIPTPPCLPQTDTGVKRYGGLSGKGLEAAGRRRGCHLPCVTATAGVLCGWCRLVLLLCRRCSTHSAMHLVLLGLGWEVGTRNVHPPIFALGNGCVWGQPLPWGSSCQRAQCPSKGPLIHDNNLLACQPQPRPGFGEAGKMPRRRGAAATLHCSP